MSTSVMKQLKQIFIVTIAGSLLTACVPSGSVSLQEKNNNKSISFSQPEARFHSQCLNSKSSDSGGSPGIIGGEVLKDESELSQVVGLLLIHWSFLENGKTQNKISVCTGSRVDQNVVLTAAHCVTPWEFILNGTDKESQIRRTVYFISGAQPFCGIEAEVDFAEAMKQLKAQRAIEIKTHEGFIDIKNQRVNSDLDIALLRLEERFDQSTSFKAIQLVSSQKITSSTKISIAGYGLSQENEKVKSLQPVLRMAKTQLAAPNILQDLGFDSSRKIGSDTEQTINELSLPPENRGSILLANLAEGRNACSGDSGGPAVVAQGGALLQFGLASRVENFEMSINPCLVATHYLNLGKLRSWLEKNFDLIKGKSLKKGKDLFLVI